MASNPPPPGGAPSPTSMDAVLYALQLTTGFELPVPNPRQPITQEYVIQQIQAQQQSLSQQPPGQQPQSQGAQSQALGQHSAYAQQHGYAQQPHGHQYQTFGPQSFGQQTLAQQPQSFAQQSGYAQQPQHATQQHIGQQPQFPAQHPGYAQQPQYITQQPAGYQPQYVAQQPVGQQPQFPIQQSGFAQQPQYVAQQSVGQQPQFPTHHSGYVQQPQVQQPFYFGEQPLSQQSPVPPSQSFDQQSQSLGQQPSTQQPLDEASLDNESLDNESLDNESLDNIPLDEALPSLDVDELPEALKERVQDMNERQYRTEDDLQSYGVPIGSVHDDLDDSFDAIEMEELKGPDVKLDMFGNDYDPRQKRFKFSKAYIHGHFNGQDPYTLDNQMAQLSLSLKHSSTDLVTALSQNLELAIEVGRHLRPEDILSLYIACLGFRKAVDGHFLSCIRMWVDTRAPEAGKTFNWRLYKSILIKDPAGRKWADQNPALRQVMNPNEVNEVRLVPGLKYIQLVLGRDRYCREIIAIMARMGFLMPATMYSTLLRIWLLMDVSTTHQRKALLHNKEYWTDQHLYNAQLFFIKLGMAFTHPFYRPHSPDMVQIMMGQKGLYPLWQCLTRKKYRNIVEVMQLKARYDMRFPRAAWQQLLRRRVDHVYGVPISKVGTGHCEGWGKGARHLSRPEELIPVEAVLRGLELDQHLEHMITWGYINFTTGENIVPTEEDMYISDEEDTLSKVDTTYLWQRRHALKKRWNELTHEQRQEIQEDDEDECLRAMAWSGGVDDDLEHWESESEDSDDEAYNINAEIDRNYRVPPQPRSHESMVPSKEDTAAWQELSREMVMTTIPEVSDAEYEKAQAWKDHAKSNIKGEWNLPRYLMGDAFMRSRLVAPPPPLSEGNPQYEEQDDEVYDDDDDEDDDDDDDDDDEDEDEDNGEGDNMVDG